METRSSILAWESSWTGKPGGLQPMGSRGVGHDCVAKHAPYDLAIPLLGMYPEEIKISILKRFLHSHIQLKHYSQQPRHGNNLCPLTNEQTKKHTHTHTHTHTHCVLFFILFCLFLLNFLFCIGVQPINNVMIVSDSILKSGDITLPTKVCLVKAMVFSVVMYGCESWIITKADLQRIDAFELWCWRRLLRVPWTARRSNQSILKEINPEYSMEGLMLKLKLQSFGYLMQRADSFERTLMLGKIEGRRRG